MNAGVDDGSAVQQVRDLLAAGRAGDALARARDVFASEALAASRLGELAALAAAAAQATGLVEMAELMWREAVARAAGPADTADALVELGMLLVERKRSGEAQTCFRDALELTPRHLGALANLAQLLAADARSAEAETFYRAALALAPSAEIRSNLGNLLAARGAVDEAEALLREAIALDPMLAAAHTNLGVLLADQRRDAEAEAAFRHALVLRPGDPLARLNLSVLLLAQGRFAEGWVLHEARHDPALPDNGIGPPPLATLPVWQGESLAGKAVLVWAEQGFGDQIQFARYAERLKAHGARAVTWVCQTPLHALFETLRGVDRVLAADVVDNAFHVDPALLAGHDVWAFPLSLPRWLGTDLATLPEVALPYLRAPLARRIEPLGERSAPRRIGLVWRGNPRHHNDAERSLPGLAALAPLWGLPGVEFASLQTGRTGLGEAAAAPDDQPLLDLGPTLRDFADTAAALDAVDLLICVDTSIAHLAGALGRPCWVLLPAHRTDWRWLRDRDDSPWYPSMRLFRQTQRGDWAGVLARVCDALAAEPRP